MGVRFLSNTDLVAYSTVLNDIAVKKQNGPASTGQYVLRLMALSEVADDKKPIVAEWPAYRIPAVMANSSGQAVVQTGNILRLVAPDLHVSKVWEGPDLLLPSYNGSSSTISPSGNTLLYESVSFTSTPATRIASDVRVLDARTLEVKAEWQAGFMLYPFSLSDSGILKSDSSGSGEVYFREFSGKWQLFADRKSLKCWILDFFDELRVLSACGKELALLSLDGRILSKQTLGSKSYGNLGGKIARAKERKTVVLDLTKFRGDLLDITWISRRTVLVVDVERKQTLLSINIKPLPTTVGTDAKFDFDISPDGSRVAVLVNSTVKLYKVPGSI